MNFADHSKVNAALYRFAGTYLEKRGWFNSLDGVPRNKDGVVPWITYPAFRQLQRIVKPGGRVFEYGCGGSSLWWAANAAEVISVEHDAQWAARVSGSAPGNLKIIAREMGAQCSDERRSAVAPFFASPPELPVSPSAKHNIEHGLLCEEFVAYATEIVEYEKQSFDVVVVDGMARSLTAWLAAQYVKPDGIIVFDNSDRWQYNGGFRILNEAGFRRIDFYGPGPVNAFEWCTSLFVRNLDVFVTNIDSPHGDCDLGW